MTEVGSDPSLAQHGHALSLPPTPFTHPRHCVIANTETVVTVTPNHPEAETYVNGQRIGRVSAILVTFLLPDFSVELKLPNLHVL